jgi:hypothetical protein
VRGELEPLGIAAQAPEMRHQVVGQVHRLRPLQVRVARHRPVEMLLGTLGEQAHQLADHLARHVCTLVDEQRHVGGHLVVARPGRVQLAPDRADDLRQAPLDGHVDVLVVVAHLEAAVGDLGAHLIEAALQLGELVVVEDPGAGEHPRVRQRAVEVVRREPGVEADRRVDRAEAWVLWVGEAGHRGSV